MPGDSPNLANLPPQPQPPTDYECCGGGCADCDFRAYVRELAHWTRLKNDLLGISPPKAPA